jgi:epoxide hydrolase
LFTISFSKEKIKDLHRKLDAMIWPDMPFDTGWSASTHDKVLKDLVRNWRNEYGWFKQQDKLNQLPHFIPASTAPSHNLYIC